MTPDSKADSGIDPTTAEDAAFKDDMEDADAESESEESDGGALDVDESDA